MVVNLIAYNPGRKFKPSTNEATKKFKNTLERAGVQVTERYRQGQDVKGACGQLAHNA
jgi:23S rRNA (adenine2503-C2)-methyltransferase